MCTQHPAQCPWGEGRRAIEAREAIADYMKVSDGANDPILLEFLDKIFANRGVRRRRHAAGVAEEIFQDIGAHTI